MNLRKRRVGEKERREREGGSRELQREGKSTNPPPQLSQNPPFPSAANTRRSSRRAPPPRTRPRGLHPLRSGAVCRDLAAGPRGRRELGWRWRYWRAGAF
ncbi:hypothetical protein PVAP13_5NG507686 [Panicum virgatum]|uniref:Uncharacterized protein n=1 Tax=Panicum virgatum TaxID=38727 RepID=A0A8T0S2F0_PANVG|nr:hypothetical protein PVAP13_5NG507686 [Panicum virgatum]